MKNVDAILAMSTDGIIGRGTALPWRHKGDLQRFKRLTSGNALILGMRTFLGMLVYHTKPGATFLPERKVFVYGRPREPNLWDIPTTALQSEVMTAMRSAGVSGDVQAFTPMGDAETELAYLNSLLEPGQRLFIGGGNQIYQHYLTQAERIYLTSISTNIIKTDDLVHLDGDLFKYLSGIEHVQEWGVEVEGDVIARYMLLGDINA